MSRSTFSIQFYCRDSKKNKQGKAHLELSIILNGKRSFINLPYQASPSQFNQKRQPKEIVEYCDNMRARVNSILNEMLRNGEPLTLERLREYIRCGGYKSYTLEDLFNEYLTILKKRVGKDLTQGVYRKYELVRDLFFENNDKTKEASTITPYMVSSFYEVLRGKYQSATSAGYMTKLKTFIQYGLDTNKLQVNPFAALKITKERKPIITLSKEEQDILSNANIPNESLQRVLDCALFELNSGISYADMLLINKEDVQEINGTYYINKRRQKTGSEYTAVLFPKAIEILRKYDYKLPIISNQKSNLFLQRIQEYLVIKTHLTTHIFRHTYLSNLLNKGVRLETVSRCAGHHSVKVTETFYARLENKTILDEVNEVMNTK